MEKKKRSPLMVIGFAVLIHFLVITLLEVRSIPFGGVPLDAFNDVKEVEGQMLTLGRAPGDLITKSVVGESSASGIPSQLEPGHVSLAVRMDMVSGVAGLIREGHTVTLVCL